MASESRASRSGSLLQPAGWFALGRSILGVSGSSPLARSEWTPEGHIRHPSFKGLRADKGASAIVRETASPAAATSKPASSIKVTNPERVIDPSTGLKKIDLVRYYESIAERMLPHLKDRPVSLVRAPTGVGGELFFQKHPETRCRG